MNLYLKFVSMHFTSIVSHKKDFVFSMITQLIVPLTSLLSIYLLFDRFGEVAGYSFEEVLLCFAIINFSFDFGEMIGRGFDMFSPTISDGSFDRMLARPKNLFFQVITSKIEFNRLGRLPISITMLAYSLNLVNIDFNLLNTSCLILLLVCGPIIFLNLFIIYATFCFFTIEGLEFMNIFTNGGKQISMYPLDIYEEWIRKLFTFFIPFSLINYYPLMFFLETPGYTNLLYAFSPLLSLLMLIPVILFWNFGVKNYQSTGS